MSIKLCNFWNSLSIPPNATASLLDGYLRFTGSAVNSTQVTNVTKDLGVLMDNSFSFSTHCQEAAFKARRMLFMIRRSFIELSVSSFAALYNTLVRPHLEYAMQACSPNLVADADYLEQIQPPFIFCQCGLAWEVILSKFCRVLAGAFEENRPFP